MKALFVTLVIFAMPSLAAAKTCPAAGVPLFEIDHRVDANAKLPSSMLKIYATGGWTFAPVDADGKALPVSRGCFDKAQLAAIRQALRAAPWQITHTKIVCMAYSAQFTDYLVRGKRKFRARMCGEESLDATSLASIKQIDAIAGGVMSR